MIDANRVLNKYTAITTKDTVMVEMRPNYWECQHLPQMC